MIFKKAVFLFGVFFFGTSVSSRGQAIFEYNENCVNAYKLLFELRFNEAEAIINKEKRIQPNNGIPVYLEHYILFLKAFISEEDADYQSLKKHQQLASAFLEKGGASPYQRWALAEINALTAFVRFKSGEYVSGALEIRRAYKLLEQNNEQYPQFKFNLKALGLMHAFIGAVPENYKWLLKLVGMRGTIRQGLDELKVLFKEVADVKSPLNFISKEVAFVYLFTLQHLEKKPEDAIKLMGNYFDNDNPIDLFFACNVYYNAGKNNEALALLTKMDNKSDTYPFSYLTYLKGIAKLNTLDLTSAVEFKKYVSEFKGKSFIKAGWQKLAWVSLMNGDTAAYHLNLSHVIKFGNEFTDEDKQAMKEAEEMEMPNVLLLKARLLFDGGNYKQALGLLAGKGMENFPTLKNKLELTYRLGRIYDRMGMEKNAIDLYVKTFENGQKFNYYFAANSCLHLGQIFENKNEKENAEKYYRQCLQLRNHEYQNSIDQKAKAGLNRLGKNTVSDE